VPGAPLQVQGALLPNQSINASLLVSTNGPVQKMEPLNTLQVHTMGVTVGLLYFSRFFPAGGR